MWIVWMILSVALLYVNCALTSKNCKYAPLAMAGSITAAALTVYCEYLNIFNLIRGSYEHMARAGAMRFVLPVFMFLMVALNLVVTFILTQENNPASKFHIELKKEVKVEEAPVVEEPVIEPEIVSLPEPEPVVEEEPIIEEIPVVQEEPQVEENATVEPLIDENELENASIADDIVEEKNEPEVDEVALEEASLAEDEVNKSTEPEIDEKSLEEASLVEEEMPAYSSLEELEKALREASYVDDEISDDDK